MNESQECIIKVGTLNNLFLKDPSGPVLTHPNIAEIANLEPKGWQYTIHDTFTFISNHLFIFSWFYTILGSVLQTPYISYKNVNVHITQFVWVSCDLSSADNYINFFLPVLCL